MLPALTVSFVCTGNICRSPTAEVVFRALVQDAGLGEQIACSSAGLGGWHVGDGADRRTVATLRQAGYDGAAHRARQWSNSWWAECDVVIALDHTHLDELRAQAPAGREVALLRDFDPQVAGQHLDVPDPYFGGAGGFTQVLTMIEDACRGLLAHLQERLAA